MKAKRADAEWDWSIYNDAELLAMLRETEAVGYPEDKGFCDNIRRELVKRWTAQYRVKEQKK